MKHLAWAAALAAALALAGCGTSSTTTTVIRTVTASAEPAVVFEAPGYSGIGPAVIYWSGSGQAVTKDITWSSWGSAKAAGTGEYGLDDCTPDCATGTFHFESAALTLSDPVDKGQGQPVIWTRLTQVAGGSVTTWTYPSAWPAGAS